jgi:hypothetical protein
MYEFSKDFVYRFLYFCKDFLKNNVLINMVDIILPCAASWNPRPARIPILKGHCHEIFDLWFFFHQSNPPRPLIKRLQPFSIWHRIRRNILFKSRQNWCQQCHLHCGNGFNGCNWHRSNSNIINYLGEYEAICKTVLAHYSGPKEGLFDERHQGSEISWQCPFNK